MAKTKEIVLFGTGEIASLAKFYFENDGNRKIAAFTVDDEYIKEDSFEGCPVVPYSDIKAKYNSREFDMHIALSYARLNALRDEKFKRAQKDGYTLASYISSQSAVCSSAKIGANCFILESQTIQPNVKIADNVMLWSGNHIGHSSSIGQSTYLASHVVICGNCKIGQRNFFGVNSAVKDFCEIKDDCFITMNSAVTVDLPSGCVVLGSKSEVLDSNDKRAKMLKRTYFKSKS